MFIDNSNSEQPCDLKRSNTKNDDLKTHVLEKLKQEIHNTTIPTSQLKKPSVIKENAATKKCYSGAPPNTILKNNSVRDGGNCNYSCKENISIKSKLPFNAKSPPTYSEGHSYISTNKTYLKEKTQLDQPSDPTRMNSKSPYNTNCPIQQSTGSGYVKKEITFTKKTSSESIIVSDNDSNNRQADDEFLTIKKKQQNKGSYHSIHSKSQILHSPSSKIPSPVYHKESSQLLAISRSKRNLPFKQIRVESVNPRECSRSQYSKHRQRAVSDSSNCSRSTISSDIKSDKRDSSPEQRRSHSLIKTVPCKR